tara:strand:+ start:1329 stop:1568 length:240 start_codon:yes stop_codon:yes gene_type:complete
MDELIKFIAASLRISHSEIDDSSSMSDIPEWDSLSHMSLIAAIEEKYTIRFTGDDIASMQSISQINEKINKYHKANKLN